MSLKKIKFGDKEVNKKEFYSSKQAILLDSVDLDKIVVSSKWNLQAYLQAYLEECKYKLRKRKIVNYTDDEIIDEDSDSDIDDAVDSHLNFSVPDSYVEI